MLGSNFSLRPGFPLWPSGEGRSRLATKGYNRSAIPIHQAGSPRPFVELYRGSTIPQRLFFQFIAGHARRRQFSRKQFSGTFAGADY
jgi:hypothetical protein